jgi:hypothetical protein
MPEIGSHIARETCPTRTSRLRIVVTGLIAQHPQLGGIAWHYMHYILGLGRLGHDVFYFEDSGEWPYALAGGPRQTDWVACDFRQNVSHLERVMRRFGLDSKWAYRNAAAGKWYGMSDQKRDSIINTADVIINVSGSVDRPETYRKRAVLVYVDTDPVFTQTKVALGTEASHRFGAQRTLNADYFKRWRERLLASRVALHDVHFSFGEKLSSKIPSTQFLWRPTRQPIVIDEWATNVSPRASFTTVMSWTSYRPLVWKGQIYGQKDVEFERFRSLPGCVPGVPLELAIGSMLHPDWEGGNGSLLLSSLGSSGWGLTNAFEVCTDLDTYRSYIVHSKGEWSVAKNGYVVGQPGWFSERSACYLAAGRPVILQDTGFSSVIPTGRGVLSFSTLDQAVSAIREVSADYERHSRAAAEIAASFFASDHILTNLLNTSFLGSGKSARRDAAGHHGA